jgi:hypothetical protein
VFSLSLSYCCRQAGCHSSPDCLVNVPIDSVGVQSSTSRNTSSVSISACGSTILSLGSLNGGSYSYVLGSMKYSLSDSSSLLLSSSASPPLLLLKSASLLLRSRLRYLLLSRSCSLGVRHNFTCSTFRFTSFLPILIWYT